ncbi:MAG: glutamate synthase central domain-containing protein, partial [Myxococcota bacterium]
MPYGYPPKRGLYDPALERESCGVAFVADIKGRRSHQTVLDADQALRNMEHRGACGCEPNTGDGAGILTALPHKFLRKVCKDDLQVDLPEPGKFAAGLVFLPKKPDEREHCKNAVEKIVAEEGQRLVGWRQVPVQPDAADVGPTARAAEPAIEQLFIEARGVEGEAFERQLYVIHKRASTMLRTDSNLEQAQMFYICSLSTKVIVYKGMLTSWQVMPYYPDLQDPDFETHLAMVHSRFSTNTFPSWDRAQPLRFMSHNGEINTLRGNKNWTFARQGVAESELFGKDLRKLFPVVEPDCSDSGTFDNVLEFLLMTGRTLQEAIMMMIPEAWENHEQMSRTKRAFYEYHSCLMEPWDGPASIAFTDGHYIGAVLDRNGLRPSRYYLTHDDKVIMASEVGVLPVDPKNVKSKGRLQPGRMFLVDFEQGRLVPDEEVKESIASQRPYEKWLEAQRIELNNLEASQAPGGFDPERLLQRMQAFGYTTETMQFMLLPLVQQKRDPVGSMGNDSALAVLSDQPRMLYDYFKQLFAQVTNPAIDSIREETIMSLECYIGPEQNLLEATPEHAHRLLVRHPILTNEELTALAHLDHRGWSSKVIDITWPREEGEAGLVKALDRICAEAEQAIEDGHGIVVLSDRQVGPDRVAVSALLATGAVHHHLVNREKRTRIGLVVETGEAREVHHHCLLVGYGADAVNPYLAFEALWQARLDGLLAGDEYDSYDRLVGLYRKGVAKGMLKVFAKMGISTLRSYKGAQIFEAVGLDEEVVARCFHGTASRIKGVGFEVLAAELMRRHEMGYPQRDEVRLPVLSNDGQFHWRAKGERHMWDPESIADIQVAARSNDRGAYWRFSKHANDDARTRCTLRGLLRLKEGAAGGPVPLEEVEPASEIVKRFC